MMLHLPHFPGFLGGQKAVGKLNRTTQKRDTWFSAIPLGKSPKP